MIRYFTFEMYHGKRNIGSTNLRVHNLIKYWPEADLYKYGENPDILIYQKVFVTADYRFPEHFKNKQILDICDPEWLNQQAIKQTIDCMDAVTVPTEALAEFIRQMTNNPVAVIPDRHDISLVPKPKVHSGKITKFMWFGYKQNAELLRFVVPYLEKNNYQLTVISNEDPMVDKWARGEIKYTFVKYPDTDQEFYLEAQKSDVCILPEGNRPEDRFKSNNKTTKAWLAGLPVVKTAEDVESLMDEKARQAEATLCYNKAIKEYDCRESVKEMKELIDELHSRD